MRNLFSYFAVIFLSVPCMGAELLCVSSSGHQLTAQILSPNTLSNLSLISSRGQSLLSTREPLTSTLVPRDGLSVTQGAGVFRIGSIRFYTAPVLTLSGMIQYSDSVRGVYGSHGENAMMSDGSVIQLALRCQIR